jgi:hypothetical protein
MSQPNLTRLTHTERSVWVRFLTMAPAQGLDWRYEEELGVGSYGPAGGPELPPEFYLRLLKKRVDAVAEEPHRTILAEVKEVGGMAALGQLLTYRLLWMAEKGPRGRIDLWVVCGRADYDVLPAFTFYGVSLFETGL